MFWMFTPSPLLIIGPFDVGVVVLEVGLSEDHVILYHIVATSSRLIGA